MRKTFLKFIALIALVPCLLSGCTKELEIDGMSLEQILIGNWFVTSSTSYTFNKDHTYYILNGSEGKWSVSSESSIKLERVTDDGNTVCTFIYFTYISHDRLRTANSSYEWKKK